MARVGFRLIYAAFSKFSLGRAVTAYFWVLRRNSWEGAIHAALLKTTNSVLVAAIR
jgi:hypothetical protein